jgi:hypothetical protein
MLDKQENHRRTTSIVPDEYFVYLKTIVEARRPLFKKQGDYRKAK